MRIKLNKAIIIKSNIIRKAFCLFNIHFSGYCISGGFCCPYCGEVLDIWNEQWFYETKLAELQEVNNEK